MALNIRNREAEQLAAEISKLTGETKTEVVRKALVARLKQIKESTRPGFFLAQELDRIALHCSSLPVLDDRGPEEMLYDENGLPK